LFFSIPRHEFQWLLAVAMAGFPVLLAAFLVYPAVEPRISTPLRVKARVAGTPGWRDAVVLLALASVLELRPLGLIRGWAACPSSTSPMWRSTFTWWFAESKEWVIPSFPTDEVS
jgi:hypothetical protein